MTRGARRLMALGLALLAGLAGLAGCTNDPAGTPVSLAGTLGALRAALPGGSAPGATADAAPALTAEALDALPLPTIILVRRVETGAFALMSPVGGNNGAQVFMSQDRDAVTLQAGFVVATNGFGHDLYGLELEGATRRYRFLTADNRLVTETLRCTPASAEAVPLTLLGTTYDTQKVTERCSGDGRAITNLYWLEPATGTMRKSRQWVSPVFGSLEVEMLKSPPSEARPDDPEEAAQ